MELVVGLVDCLLLHTALAWEMQQQLVVVVVV